MTKTLTGERERCKRVGHLVKVVETFLESRISLGTGVMRMWMLVKRTEENFVFDKKF